MSIVDFALLLCPREFREGYRREFRYTARSEALNLAWTGIALRAESLARDAVFAVRSLAKSPLFTVIVLLTLALAISVNATVFGAIDATLMRPLPFVQTNRLVFLCAGWNSQPNCFVQLPNKFIGEYRRNTSTLDGIAAWQAMSPSLTGFGVPRALSVAWASANVFDVLQVHPELGRFFTVRDAVPGVHDLVISDEFWRNTLSADPRVIGRVLHLDGASWRIIGVTPAGVIMPVSSSGAMKPEDGYEPLPESSFASVSPTLNDWAFGRLARGASSTAATADFARTTTQLLRANPAYKGMHVTAQPFSAVYYKQTREMLYLALAVAIAVLLIACANVGNLLLARLAGRTAEIGVRNALGASRTRILHQLAIEMALVAISAGVLGLVLAFFEMRAIAALVPTALPNAVSLHIDLPVVAMTFGAVVLVALVAGTVPALLSTRRDLQATLKDAGRNADARGAKALRSGFAAAQIALAFAVIAASGLLYHSFLVIANEHTGIDAKGVHVADAMLFAPRFSSASVRARFIEDVAARVQQLPGVTAAAVARPVPYSRMGGESWYFQLPGHAYTPGSQPQVTITSITPAYFKVLRIPVLAGRKFTSTDTSAAPRVAIVARSIAQQFFNGESAVGKHILLPSNDPSSKALIPATIVGEVGDVNAEVNGPALYIPESQWPTQVAQIVVRSTAAQPTLGHELAVTVAAVDPLEALNSVYSLQARMDSIFAPQRSSALLVGILAAVALLLALAGLYGVLSYNVEQRRHEIGVRMAIGAPALAVLRGVLLNALAVATIGITFGIVIAAGGSRLLADLLVGVSPFDPTTFVSVIILLLVCVVVAALVPALRAASIDPAKALRYE